MNDNYELLAEKELMWAEMLEQVLKDNGVDCVSVPVYGAGMVLRGDFCRSARRSGRPRR